jgi:N utilization substance protein B
LDADPEFGADKLKRLRKMRLFTEERVKGVLADLNEIDDALSGLLDHWDVYRLGTVERAVLRLGLWEMRNSDVPTPVVINEAVDIANWFSSSKTRSIINGILDKVAKAKEDSPSEK